MITNTSAGLPPSADAVERFERLTARIASACSSADRDVSAVRLLAITKTHPPDAVRELIGLGLDEFGENRVQELIEKQAVVGGGKWHLVGALQTNKVRQVVGHRLLIHSVDRRRLVTELARRASRANLNQRILIQVNVGDDPAKSGCASHEALDLVAYAREQSNLTVEGLMTIPPLPPDDVDPNEAARPHFARLRQLRDQARERWPEVTHLSMGMSNDLEAAILEGATILRVGSALLGPRQPAPWRQAGGNT